MRNNEERLGAQQKIQQDVAPVLQQNGLNLNFIAPTEYVDLPSGGKFYPVGHPLRDKNSLEIKQMTAKEEDILTNKSLLKKGVALEKLVESIIVDKSIKPSDLLICDKNAIYLAARISAYGPEYASQVQCPACEKKSKYVFDLLEKLEEETEKSLEKAYKIGENGLITIVLPGVKWAVECRALTGEDEKQLLNVMSSNSKKEFTLLEQFSMFIVSIQGVTDKETIKQAIQSMPASDSRFLRKQYDEAIPSLQIKSTFVCPSCEYDEVMEVPLTAEFFWPK